MSREIKFRAWIRFMRKITPVIELYQDGGLMVDCYEYAIESDAIDLMQYIGLKDKSGVDIYEGDILARGESNGREVKFDGASFVVSDESNQANQIISKFTASRLLVVGNIYENPELIGE